MLFNALPALLIGSVSVGHTLPKSSHLALWNAADGKLLKQWPTLPFRSAYGAQPVNVSAPLVRADPQIACAGDDLKWNGRVVLGGDWTTPGCSIQVRAKNFQARGAVAAIFQGTEGVPFDWDGSDVSDVHITVVIVRTKDYKELDASAVAAGGTPLAVAFAPAVTPLLLNIPFVVVERAIQIVFIIAAVYVSALAVWQLVRFRRVAKQMGSDQNKHAIRVVGCELIATLSILVYIIDGPYMEHTRPCVLPWFVHRISLSLHVEFHLLAALFFYWHLRQIRKRVESGPRETTRHCAAKKRGSLGTMVSLFLEGRSSKLGGQIHLEERCPRLTSALAMSKSHLFLIVISICLVCDFASAILVGLYFSASDGFTLFTTAFVALVSFAIGAWFAYQALMIIRALKLAEQDGAKVGSRSCPSSPRMHPAMASR